MSAPGVTRILLESFDRGGFTCRSDVARENAELVAIAAYYRLISTERPDGSFDNIWRLTPVGLEMLFSEQIDEDL